MIVVTVALVSAVTNKTSTLAIMVIANDGTGSADAGNYSCLQLRAPRFNIETPARRGRVEAHRRKALSVWSLVAKALAGLGHGGEQ